LYSGGYTYVQKGIKNKKTKTIKKNKNWATKLNNRKNRMKKKERKK
jgi:hypothetical protein